MSLLCAKSIETTAGIDFSNCMVNSRIRLRTKFCMFTNAEVENLPVTERQLYPSYTLLCNNGIRLEASV